MLDRIQTGGLRILARQNTLTDADWFNLLEERRALIEPHLREMTLKSLGDLKIVRCWNKDVRPLRMGGMIKEFTTREPTFRFYWTASELKAVEGNFPLETRGIFPDDDVFYHGHFKWDFIRVPERVAAVGEVLTFWGLTRNNQWIKAEATVNFFAHQRPSGPLEQRTEVEKLIVCESTPSEICQSCGVTPRWIWQRLGDAVEAWVTHRRRLLSKAEQLAEVVRQEKAMIDIVAPK